MFSSGFKSAKLNTSARLSINRLKLMERKKTEQAQKARKEIADFLSIGKDERARIRVEHIIREDYLVEAMEIVEMYLDLLMARMGLIQSTKVLDPGIQEAVASIIWVTPRMSAEVQELKSVSDQLIYKYGKEFAEQARNGTCTFINEGLKHKLGLDPPSKCLVENYLVAIAKSHNVAYEPDPSILSPPEIETLLLDLGEEGLGGGKKGSGGAGGGCGNCGGGGGTQVNLPPQPQAQPYPPPAGQPAYPPPAQAYPPAAQAYPPSNPAYPPSNPAYPPPAQAYPPQGNVANDPPQPPSYSAVGAPGRSSHSQPSMNPSAPPYSENDPLYPPKPPGNGQAPSAPKPETLMPVLPQVPTNSFPPLDNSVGGNSAGGEDVDFDDLSRRFEELKKKK